ncbi:MAG: hypothetical protein AAFQ82_19700 [Myxococcota bacterium]
MARSLAKVAGVLSMLLYFFGSVGFALLVNEAVRSEEPLSFNERGQVVLLACGGCLLAAVLLQALRERGAESALTEVSDESSDSPRSWVEMKRFWLALVGVPTVVSWAEFELFVDPVDMFPLLTLIGGIGFGVTLANSVATRALKSTQRMLAVAILGLPLGFLSIGWPSAHFRSHGSGVDLWGVDELGALTPYSLEPSPQPRAPSRPVMGTEELSQFGAIANAQEVNVSAKLESGEWSYIDGTLHERNASGEYVPIEMATADDLDQMFDEARRADDAAHRKALDEHEEALEKHRRGGRLFSAP